MKQSNSGRVAAQIRPTRIALVVAAICAGISGAAFAQAQSDPRADGEERSLPRVDVVGTASVATRAPGSAAVIDARTLE